MSTVVDIRKQLKELCEHNRINLVSTQNNDNIMKCLLHGLFVNVAEHISNGKYQTVSVV